jgi:hypothetical protein
MYIHTNIDKIQVSQMLNNLAHVATTELQNENKFLLYRVYNELCWGVFSNQSHLDHFYCFSCESYVHTLHILLSHFGNVAATLLLQAHSSLCIRCLSFPYSAKKSVAKCVEVTGRRQWNVVGWSAAEWLSVINRKILAFVKVIIDCIV